MAPMKQTLAPSPVTTRDPKGRKFLEIVTAAYDKAKLSDGPDGEAQRINNTPGLAEIIGNFIAENRTPNKYKDEEVPSNYGYLSGYKKPMGLNAQCNQLRILFPGIGYTNQDLQERIEKDEVKLPQNAEGWFAIPNWKKNPKLFGSTYSEAVQKVLDAIKKARDGAFHNYRAGQIDEQHLRQSARSEQFWNDLAKAQGDADILIIAAQFGIRHRGRSIRRAHVVIEDTKGEFALGAFAGVTMIITNPNQLMDYNDLWVDLGGDEFDVPESDVRFDSAPCLRFGGGGVGFAARCVDRACGGLRLRLGLPSAVILVFEFLMLLTSCLLQLEFEFFRGYPRCGWPRFFILGNCDKVVSSLAHVRLFVFVESKHNLPSPDSFSLGREMARVLPSCSYEIGEACRIKRYCLLSSMADY